MDKKLMRNGTGWAIAVNSTILKLLDITPETDLIKFTVEGDKLIITKSPNKRTDLKK